MRLPESVNRRYLIAGIATGVALLAGTVAALVRFNLIRKLPIIGTDPEHLIEVKNQRNTSQKVAVTYDVDGEGMDHGPWTIKPGETWGVTTVEEWGELTLSVFVDGERVWKDTYEVPYPEDGPTAVRLTLEPDGRVNPLYRGGDEFVRSTYHMGMKNNI